MTTNVLIVQSRPGLLAIANPVVSQRLTGQVQSLAITSGDDLPLAREAAGEAWIINQGPRTIRMEYTTPDAEAPAGRRTVGPTHDYILPGQAKEVGAGPSVWWHLREAA